MNKMELHLAKNIYDNPEMVPSRYGYGDGLVELGKKNKNVVVIGADLTSSLTFSCAIFSVLLWTKFDGTLIDM